MADPEDDWFETATARGNARLTEPRAERVRFDAGRNRVVITLTTGVEIGFAPQDAEGLQNATAADLRQAQLDTFGLGVHFPTLDADFYIPALLKGHLGSERWMATLARHRRRTGNAA